MIPHLRSLLEVGFMCNEQLFPTDFMVSVLLIMFQSYQDFVLLVESKGTLRKWLYNNSIISSVLPKSSIYTSGVC